MSSTKRFISFLKFIRTRTHAHTHTHTHTHVRTHARTYIYSTSLSLVGNSGGLTWVRHNSRKSSATHSYQCVYRIFVCPNNGMAARVWDFLTSAQMLTHVTAHRGCADTVRESALKVDSWIKNKKPCRTGDSNPCQYIAYCAWLNFTGFQARSKDLRDLRGGRWSWTLNLAQKRS